MINEIQSKSILRKSKKIDSWFLSHYGINLYRGCTHNCVYCDGRAEKYQVDGEFGKDLSVKTNAIELLNRELDPSCRRNPMPGSFMMLCGGVSDAYQPAEEKYQLARQSLELIHKYDYPVHILTKSTLIERDLDILQKINQQKKALVSFSFSSMNDELSSIFEPGVPPPGKKLETIKKLKDSGISCGMFLMPVIPYITDTAEMLDETLNRGKDAGIDFVIFGSMTLKRGKQKEYFMKVIKKSFPSLVPEYEFQYANGGDWGSVSQQYNNAIHALFSNIADNHNIPKRIPPVIYQKFISKQDRVIVILEHLDYLLKLKNQKSPYGYAAYALSQKKDLIENLSDKELLSIQGIGPVTVKLIREIIDTGRCMYYESLL